jgi:lactoylglutathione lyase
MGAVVHMKFKFNHNNFNVTDIEKSIKFYEQALGLAVNFRMPAPDGSFEIVFLGDGATGHSLELTWLRDKEGAYELGDNEIHLALCVDDMDAALKKHSDMGCVCFKNEQMGIYFIEDPDGYWVEIVPERR